MHGGRFKVSWAIATLLLTLGAGCQSVPSESLTTAPSPIPSVAASLPASTPTPTPTPVPVNLYQRGLDRGASAANLSQNAQSRDDWRLVVALWQQAIDQLRAIPAGNPDHTKAQQKIQEYQRNLTIAQARVDRPTPTVSPTPLADILSPNSPPPRNVAPPPAVPTAANPSAQSTQNAQVFRVPIIQRAGGTPVINVTFNGSQTFPMILDTGASGTVITQSMASILGVRTVGQARVNTASAANVAFPLGYVDSIEAGGVAAEDVLVAIAGPELRLGLLGQDFFSAYDVTIRQQEVEFRIR